MAGFEAMFSAKTVSRLGYSLRGLVAGVFVVVAATGRGQCFIPESVGVRGGASFTGGQGGEFYQTEAFADWNLPWKTESDSGWFLQTKLNLSAGWLGGNGINARGGDLAPAVGFGRRHFPLSLEGGIGPTFISNYDFGSLNFGEKLQFTSFIGRQLGPDVTLAIRLPVPAHVQRRLRPEQPRVEPEYVCPELCLLSYIATVIYERHTRSVSDTAAIRPRQRPAGDVLLAAAIGEGRSGAGFEAAGDDPAGAGVGAAQLRRQTRDRAERAGAGELEA